MEGMISNDDHVVETLLHTEDFCLFQDVVDSW